MTDHVFEVRAAGLDWEVSLDEKGNLEEVYLNGLLIPDASLCSISISRGVTGELITLAAYLGAEAGLMLDDLNDHKARLQ